MTNSYRWLKWLNLGTLMLLLINTALIFLYAPTERTMGEVQRIFYFHFGAAWMSMLAFFVTCVTGIVYLRTGQSRWDRLGAVSVEVGLVFTMMTIASGSIWARPAWNTWLTWDPRLTTYTIVALLYVAYLMLRQGLENPEQRARFASVYGIVGFVSVPITYLSIFIWRTNHPAIFGATESSTKMALSPAMYVVWGFAVVTFLALYVCLMANRLRLQQLAERVEQLKARTLSA
ncbi:MAG: cytochrome c biogenesis protein [Anaerolineales bacterium]